jgi:beta-1,4-N-acetylglucosaminyltransferase
MTEMQDAGHAARPRASKVCFVTIGATASFDKLLRAVLEHSFLTALQNAEYTDLIIQYGKEEGKAIYDAFVAAKGHLVRRNMGIDITGFDFKTSGLGQEMRMAKGDAKSGSKEGLVISHAG